MYCTCGWRVGRLPLAANCAGWRPATTSSFLSRAAPHRCCLVVGRPPARAPPDKTPPLHDGCRCAAAVSGGAAIAVTGGPGGGGGVVAPRTWRVDDALGTAHGAASVPAVEAVRGRRRRLPLPAGRVVRTERWVSAGDGGGGIGTDGGGQPSSRGHGPAVVDAVGSAGMAGACAFTHVRQRRGEGLPSSSGGCGSAPGHARTAAADTWQRAGRGRGGGRPTAGCWVPPRCLPQRRGGRPCSSQPLPPRQIANLVSPAMAACTSSSRWHFICHELCVSPSTVVEVTTYVDRILPRQALRGSQSAT